MKQSEKDIDALIREALSQEEAEILEQLGEQSVPEMVTELFRGKRRWLAVFSVISQTVFVVLAIYCAVEFFAAAEIRDMLVWGAAFYCCVLASMANKLWSWMEMNRNSVTREIKRLELQIAHLASELREARKD